MRLVQTDEGTDGHPRLFNVMKGSIIVDTREQDLHILRELESRGIPCIRRKLDFGDYSFEVDGTSYERRIVIERKGSLDEIIGNFTKGRDRFRKEFIRSNGCRVILLVESFHGQIEAGQYRSRMKPADLKSFLSTWCNKFQLSLILVDRHDACDTVLQLFRKYYTEGKDDDANLQNLQETNQGRREIRDPLHAE